MSDVMLFGILRMPYDMAMHSEMYRVQFYSTAQMAADELEKTKAALKKIRSEKFSSRTSEAKFWKMQDIARDALGEK